MSTLGVLDHDESIMEGMGVIESENTEADKEFETCLQELRKEIGLKLYADTYTKLYDKYYDLRDVYNIQMEEAANYDAKYKELKDEIDHLEQTVSNNNEKIENQLQEIAEYRAMCDAMHARELASVEALETLRKQLIKLEKELAARKSAGADDDAGGMTAAKEKEKFEKEILSLNQELEGMKTRLGNALEYQHELEKKASAADLQIATMGEQLEEAENNKVRQGRLVDHLNGEIKSLKSEIEQRGKTIGMLEERTAKQERNLERKERYLRDTLQKLEITMKEQEATLARASQLKESLDNTLRTLDETREFLSTTKKDLKNKTEEATKLRMDMNKLNKTYMMHLKKFQLLEQNKFNIEAERDGLRKQTAIMDRDLMLSRKQAEADKREIENYQREKEIMTKNMQKLQVEALENLQLLNLQEQRRKQLEHEIETNEQQITKQRLLIRSLEKDKDRLLEEAIALNEKIDDLSDEVRQRNSEIIDLNKILRSEAIKLRQVTVTLEAARADISMLHKNYTEALDEITDLKIKLKMLNYQIEQSKEDSTAKERALRMCDAALVKANKKIEMLRSELQMASVKLSDARADIAALRQEEAKLHRVIQDADVHKGKLLKEIEGLVSERDIVGAQLVRRNDELALVYEKVRILDGTLQRGEKQYEQRVDDIRLLRLEIIRLRKEKNLLAKGIENMTDLRLEVFNLERELGRARLRVRALEEALERPLNVHRWRKLAGTDPDKVTLMEKLRLLQKKVLVQSETLLEKDRKMKETENLYKTVKDMMAVQPSPDIKNQLIRTQKALSQRTTKLRCLVTELNMRESQVNDYRVEVMKIRDEMDEYRSRYYQLKQWIETKVRSSTHEQPPGTPPTKLPAILLQGPVTKNKTDDRCYCDEEKKKQLRTEIDRCHCHEPDEPKKTVTIVDDCFCDDASRILEILKGKCYCDDDTLSTGILPKTCDCKIKTKK